MLPRLVLLVYILVKFSRLLLTNHNVHLGNIKGASYFQQRHSWHYWAATVQHASAWVMPKEGRAKQSVEADHAMCTCRDSTVQKRKERKQGETKEKKVIALWWRKDEWVWHLQHSQIKFHAMHHEWLETGWACGHSGQPPFVFSRVNHSWMQNVRNVNDAPTGELENRSWQEQVKNKKVNNRWKEGGQSKQKSTNRSSSFVNDVYS